MDVRSTSRVGVFGEGRFEARSFGDSGGSSAFQGFAGVAISVRATPPRAGRRAESVEELRRRYVDGPVLIVPRTGNGTINNFGATVIPGGGTVYRAMADKGEWGFFDAPGGALASNTNQISLPAPVIVDAKTLKGDGWTAVLAPGWTVRPGPGRDRSSSCGNDQVRCRKPHGCAIVRSMDRRETERLLEVIRRARAEGQPAAIATRGARQRERLSTRGHADVRPPGDGTYECSLVRRMSRTGGGRGGGARDRHR